MKAYIFSYYLIQFCGHSWIFTNIIIRFLSFGEGEKPVMAAGHEKDPVWECFNGISLSIDSVADTFYSIGLVMRICQLASILELFHIHLGIEEDHFLSRLLQITERTVILFVVIASQEEVQGKYVVCILFFLWSFMDVVRYTYCMLAAAGIYFQELTWIHYSLWIPLYPLSVLAQAFAVYESLPHFETDGTFSIQLPYPFDVSVYFPYVLKIYMVILFAGSYFIVQHLYMERNKYLGSCHAKAKKS